LFAPITLEFFQLQGLDWLYLEVLAVGIIGIIAMLDHKISIKNYIKK